MRLDFRSLLFLGLIVSARASTEARADYGVTFLVSDLSNVGAAVVDPNLKNPWGVSYAPTGPFWVSDQAANLSTLYNGAGAVQALRVTIPTNTPLTPPNGPTGQVWNGNSADFKLANGNAASFLFANLNGQISAWNGGSGTTAQVMVSAASTVYTGLAIGQVGTDNVLYAANGRGNRIDVYSSTFSNLNGSTFANKFVDATLTAAGFKVFNVQTIGSNVYVTYSNSSNGSAAVGGGAVAVFDLNGNLIRDFSNGSAGPLQDPWGVTLAPTSFGQFGGDLLVGNKESGRINAFDPTNGNFLGIVATVTNDPASANNGLWALTFGNGAAGGDRNTLYAFAGINNEANGLMVAINAVPEPGSIVLMGIGGVLATVAGRWRGRGAG